MLKLWKNNQLKSEILGINERNMSYVYALNPKEHFILADDKIRCKKILEAHGLACAKTYCIVERIGDIPQAIQAIQSYQSLAIKPAKGSGGGGILILRKNESGQWVSGNKIWKEQAIYSHLAKIMMGMYSFGHSDRVLIEECIQPHPFFSEIYPAGVPDFRVIVLEGKAIMSMLRMPTDRSDGKANLHQGGLGIGIDMERGVLKQAFDGQRYHDIHPDNQAQILAKEIPYWKQLLELSIETASHFPLQYLGIDIVLDAKKGPMIMEINVRPGLGIQLANKLGLKPFLLSSQLK